MLETFPAISHSASSYHERRSSPSDGRSSAYSAVSALSVDDVGKEDLAVPVNDTEQSTVNQPGASATEERKGFLGSLSALCFTLHLLLVLIHIAVLLSAIHHWEHRFTFLIEHQTTVSFWTAVVSQSFGTIYCAVLVLLTQKLAMQRTTELMTFTAVHDNISAWAGLGSALATLFNQVSVPASVLGTLSIVGYLGCIATIHVSIPAIISVDAFNATARVAIPVRTSGMPEYANSSVMNATLDYMITFPGQLLPWRGIFDDSQMLGLSNGSLYEVLDVTTPGNDKAQVSAIGFNITCGYLSAEIQSVTSDIMTLLVDGVANFTIGSDALLPNTVSVYPLGSPNNSLVMWTTIAISDSEGHQGSPILFDQQSHSVLQNLTQLNLNISQLELFRCSKSLVAQTGLISAQSNTIVNGSLYPDIHKTQSIWVPGLELDFISQGSSLLGNDLIIMSPVASRRSFLTPLDDKCENGGRFLMSYLGIDPFVNTSDMVLQLHDIENALSNLVALLFWTGGHITPDPWYTRYALTRDVHFVGGIPPQLVAGNATINQQEALQIRLNNTPKLSSPLVERIRGFAWTYNFSHSNEPVYQIPLDRQSPRASGYKGYWPTFGGGVISENVQLPSQMFNNRLNPTLERQD
ncbi:hypothetical protein GGX14DRAFT_600487 [Mycena pura]|uniref:Uncharacterized protein n=1 Tax=Mycena pura TaxID=153505 RepID=A0AAD6Y0V5_9AGAR|nr:hypothetical protein GGX14DRAFT_600487 [Mycena pura]